MAGKPTLAERLLAQRDTWCDLGDGLRVKLRRPAETELLALSQGLGMARVIAAAVDWDGFSEAVLLGPEVGAVDALPFDADVWAAWIGDHAEAAGRCATTLRDAVEQHLEKVKAARGN